MKQLASKSGDGDGAGGRKSPTSNSQFNWWRQKHRQQKMADDITSNHNPAMMTVTENNHGGSVATVVSQSAQDRSVVGPLMGVFEDLIKSSTPQVPPLSSHQIGVNRGSDSMRSKKSRSNDSDGRNAAKRRKGKTSTDDQRWSKRFTWPDELHREFVSAIFDVGLKHSSPSAIMEFMNPNPNITSERVKSHLQKYRKNRDRSRKEFMTSYENSLQGFKNQTGADFDDDTSEDRGGLTAGEAAAFCTHVVSSQREGGGSYDSSTSRRSSPVPMTNSGGTLNLPNLTTEERDGPIGRSFDCLMGLFQSLSQQLEASRGGGIMSAAPSAHLPASSQSHQHPSHQQSIPHSVEQAVVNAASSMHPSSSFNEVAYTVPHTLSEPVQSNQAQTHQGHHQLQGDSSRGYQHQPSQHDYSDSHAAHYTHKLAPQYHSHDEIPSIPFSPPRPTHADDPGKPQAQIATATAPQYAQSNSIQHAPAHANQYHSTPQDQEAALKAPLPPQQSSASTSKAQKESTIMKQEMRGQRAFQNKMRAMMQNEMNKYGGNELGSQIGVAAASDHAGHSMDHSELQPHSSNEHDSPHMTHEPDNQFWNIENDDEIFDFLMQS